MAFRPPHAGDHDVGQAALNGKQLSTLCSPMTRWEATHEFRERVRTVLKMQLKWKLQRHVGPTQSARSLVDRIGSRNPPSQQEY